MATAVHSPPQPSEVTSDPVVILSAIRAGHPKFSKVRAVASIPPAALALALQQSRATTELCLSGLRYTREELCGVLEALSMCDRLRVVDFSDMDLDLDTLLDIADLVANSESLMRVDLSYNDVPPEAAEALGRAIRDHSTMRVLILRDVDLRDDGLDGLLSNVGPDGCSLHKLVLSHNGITDQGSAALAAFVRKNTELTCVNTNGNVVPSDAAELISNCCERNIARIGYNPASRPASMVASRTGRPGAPAHSAPPSQPAPAAATALPSLAALRRVEDDVTLPNLTFLVSLDDEAAS